MKSLEGKVAIVTGASRGLGKAIAETLAGAGAKVVLAARSLEEIEHNAAIIRSAGGDAAAFRCDVSDLQQVEALALFALEKYGHFDIWVNNAGIAGPYGPTLDIAPQDFKAVLNTNILGAYHGSITAMRHFLPRKSGRLVNILGAGDKGPVAKQNPYASTKSWIRVFTLALAKEYKDSGVGIYAFQPGLMDTELLTQVTTFEGEGKRLQNFMPFLIRAIGRQPEAPARKVLWLAASAVPGKTNPYVNFTSRVGVLFGFLREGLRSLFHRPARQIEIHVKTIPSSFEPL